MGRGSSRVGIVRMTKSVAYIVRHGVLREIFIVLADIPTGGESSTFHRRALYGQEFHSP